MMCAFMTPVLKSDWEVYDTRTGNKTPGSSRNSSSGDTTTAHRAQQLARLRQIQRTRQQLLGQRSQSFAGPVRAPISSPSRVSLPVSPLATDGGGTKRSSSSGSLSSLHNKVVGKLRSVLRLNSADEDEVDSAQHGSSTEHSNGMAHQVDQQKKSNGREQREGRQRQRGGRVPPDAQFEALRPRHCSQPRSSGSFDNPDIAEEEREDGGALVAG